LFKKCGLILKLLGRECLTFPLADIAKENLEKILVFVLIKQTSSTNNTEELNAATY
jgi:hypothetical protein